MVCLCEATLIDHRQIQARQAIELLLLTTPLPTEIERNRTKINGGLVARGKKSIEQKTGMMDEPQATHATRSCFAIQRAGIYVHIVEKNTQAAALVPPFSFFPRSISGISKISFRELARAASFVDTQKTLARELTPPCELHVFPTYYHE